MIKVGIDPGHGGKDPGAVGPTGTYESNHNLAISLLVDRYLQEAGVSTFMTRRTDVYLGKDVRTDLLSRTIAINAEGCNYSVSIHCNSSANPAPNYFGVYIYQSGGEAERLAQCVVNSVCSATGWNTGSDTDGVHVQNLALVRETKMPAILIECGFISNPAQEAQLNDPAFQRVLAQAITNGILAHLGITKGVTTVSTDWKTDIMNQAMAKGLITQPHPPDEPAPKWFILAVCLNLLKIMGR